MPLIFRSCYTLPSRKNFNLVVQTMLHQLFDGKEGFILLRARPQHKLQIRRKHSIKETRLPV